MRKVILVAALFAALGAAPATAANLIVNGSFEDCAPVACPGAGAWAVFGSIPGWMTMAGPGIEIQSNGADGAAATHFTTFGTHYAELDSHPGPNSNSTMQQALVLSAGLYELSFWYRPRTGTQNDNGINVLFGSADPLSQVGQNPTADGTAPTNWARYAFLLTAPTDATYRLVFSAVGTQNTLGGYVDNVQLHRVPEPGVLLLLGTALIGAGSRLRRR